MAVFKGVRGVSSPRVRKGLKMRGLSGDECSLFIRFLFIGELTVGDSAGRSCLFEYITTAALGCQGVTVGTKNGFGDPE